MTPLEYARAYLDSRLEDLRQRAASIDLSRRHRANRLSANPEDQASERENEEVLERLAATTRAEIWQARHALDRVETGTYGFCERCKRIIPAERLRAVPEATLCSACAAADSLAA